MAAVGKARKATAQAAAIGSGATPSVPLAQVPATVLRRLAEAATHRLNGTGLHSSTSRLNVSTCGIRWACC